MNHRIMEKICITTEHSASSYGRPILLIDGVAYGPGDEIDEPLRRAQKDGGLLDWLIDSPLQRDARTTLGLLGRPCLELASQTLTPAMRARIARWQRRRDAALSAFFDQL